MSNCYSCTCFFITAIVGITNCGSRVIEKLKDFQNVMKEKLQKLEGAI